MVTSFLKSSIEISLISFVFLFRILMVVLPDTHFPQPVGPAISMLAIVFVLSPSPTLFLFITLHIALTASSCPITLFFKMSSMCAIFCFSFDESLAIGTFVNIYTVFAIASESINVLSVFFDN